METEGNKHEERNKAKWNSAVSREDGGRCYGKAQESRKLKMEPADGGLKAKLQTTAV